MKLKNPYTFFDQFCLRTPLLPLGFYRKLTNSQDIAVTTFVDIWKNDTIKEAIFLASPELYTEIEKWLSGESEGDENTKRLEYSFLKYISRMSSRCTPFGLFAGCSIGSFADTTTIDLNDYQDNSRQTRFDMNFLVALSQKLAKEETIKKQLLWYPNNSLYVVGDQYRYIEYKYNAQNRREHSIEAVAHTEYLETIIESAKAGKKLDDLAILLVDDEITIEEANEFINELVENQILVSEIEPSVTGKDFLEQLYGCLNGLDGVDGLLEEIRLYTRFLKQIDQKIGNQASKYFELSERVAKMNTPFELKYLFQTDMYTSLKSNKLHKRWGYKLKRVLPLLNKISKTPAETHLQKFKDAFVKRYETQEMPLAIALDTEVGIGYLQNVDSSDSTSFLDDIQIPSAPIVTNQIQWNPVQEILNQKLQDVHRDHLYVLNIEDHDFESIEPNWNDLPDTMSTIAEITTVDGEEKLVFSFIGGSSAANLLGRFSTGDTTVLKHVSHVVAVEQEMSENKVFAEVVHLPESRTGNVIRRETIREYEIPYLGKSNLAAKKQLPISDLMISVKHNRIILRSKSLNKEIAPRLTNAHNYGANALPVYHFLCDVQHQGDRNGIGFYWSEILQKHTFLPRVVYKDFILSKARWNIATASLPFRKEQDKKKRMTEVEQWRKKHQIPAMVQLIDGDNTLLINLENNNTVAMWLNSIKNKKTFTIEEFLFEEPQEMEYTNQVVISVYNQEKLLRARNNKETQVSIGRDKVVSE